MEKWWVSARRSSGKCRRTARVGSERSEPALSFTATSLSSIGVIRFVAAISNLISRELGWSMLCSAIPTEPAIEGINHQWRAGRCGKECAAWIQVQAAADNYEQKHKQAENQRVVLDLAMHRNSLLTFGHVTLATLGYVHVPQRPVEAAIALSIVFVAAEILRRRQGFVGITARAPWVLALMFGLMHGLGFASGLKDAGLPDGHIPTALLFFSIGVEAGHFLFIGCVLAITAVMLQAMSKLAPITQQRSAILQMVPPLRYRHCGDVLGHSTGGRFLSQSKCTYAARIRPTIYHSHEEYATD